MLWGGLLLGIGLMRRYTAEQKVGQPVQMWMDEGKRWLAGELVRWTGEIISGKAVWDDVGWERAFRGMPEAEKTADADPAYPGYLAHQEMRKESAYLLLFGDENSNLIDDDRWGQEGETTGGETWNLADSGETGFAGDGELKGSGLEAAALAGNTPAYYIRQRPPAGTTYLLEQLMDYDFLMKHYLLSCAGLRITNLAEIHEYFNHFYPCDKLKGFQQYSKEDFMKMFA